MNNNDPTNESYTDYEELYQSTLHHAKKYDKLRKIKLKIRKSKEDERKALQLQHDDEDLQEEEQQNVEDQSREDDDTTFLKHTNLSNNIIIKKKSILIYCKHYLEHSWFYTKEFLQS